MGHCNSRDRPTDGGCDDRPTDASCELRNGNDDQPGFAGSPAALLCRDSSIESQPVRGSESPDSDAPQDESLPSLSPIVRGESSSVQESTPCSPATPILVRGKSGGGNDAGTLSTLVADVLEGWSDVDRSAICVRDMSCQGEGSVYKVSAEGASPPVVALHCWGEDADALLKNRTTDASDLFAKAGISPARLAYGGDWFLEPWLAGGKPEFSTERLQQLGELVASIHRLPQDWYEAYRGRLCERLPELQRLPRSSHVWAWTSREYILADMRADCRSAWLNTQAFIPRAPLAARVVTAHADCHNENMLQTENGILLIDLEWACVTCAAHDLSFVCKTCCDDDVAKKRIFLEAYAEASDADTSEASIDEILFDAEVFSLATHSGGPLELWEAHDDPAKWLLTLHTFGDFIASARSSKFLQDAIVRQGIIEFVERLESLVVAQSPVVVCAAHGAPHERFVLNENGSISPEARRSLALGVGVGGCVVLVPHGDLPRRLVFQLPGDATASPFRLLLRSHPGRGLVLSPQCRQVGPGPDLPDSGMVQGLLVGPAEHSLTVSMDASILQTDDERVLHAGDPQGELRAHLGKELHKAAEEGDLARMQTLLAQGADANWVGKETSIGHTVAKEGQAKALDLLISHGLDVNARSANRGSPLIEAAAHGQVECVKRLVAVSGIDLRKKEEGKTALEWARVPAPWAERSEAHDLVVALLEDAERGSFSGRMRQDVRHMVDRMKKSGP